MARLRWAWLLATAFWLVPGLGLVRTVAVCAAVNLACAAGALALARGAGPLQPSPAAPVAPAVDSTGLLWRLAATGLPGIGYEVLVVRALSQVAENTVYTFAILPAVYLVGSALGAAAWQRWASPRPASARQLLGQLSLAPDELLSPGSEAAQARRLAAYWQARNLFLAAGRSVRPGTDVRAMLAQVQAPLLDVLRTSPDFRPAYDPLLRMAQALVQQQDPAGARSLLQALARLQPARPEAAQALLQLGPP